MALLPASPVGRAVPRAELPGAEAAAAARSSYEFQWQAFQAQGQLRLLLERRARRTSRCLLRGWLQLLPALR